MDGGGGVEEGRWMEGGEGREVGRVEGAGRRELLSVTHTHRPARSHGPSNQNRLPSKL